MRITMIGNFGLWRKGTMGARALPMAKALVERGHQVCLVLPPWDTPEDSGSEYVLDGVRIANVKLPTRIPLLWHALLTATLFHRTLSESSDIVHVFKPKAYAGLVGLALWLMKRVGLFKPRLVVDTDDWEGTGGWNEIERFPRPVKWFISWHERTALRRCDAVTVASRALELLVWSIGVPKAAVHYVPNGLFVDDSKELLATDHSSPAIAAKLADHPVVLLYTRFFEYRLERFVQLVERVVGQLPAARFIVVGKGLWGEEEMLASRLNEAGLGDKVVFAGWIAKDAIPQWLALADVAVYPMDDSLLNRSKCPMKLVDLMANGLPVVAEGVGQVAEYIEHGSSGVLVEPENVNEFAAAVVNLLGDQAARAGLGKGARERIAEKFDWRRLVVTVEQAYGLALEENVSTADLPWRPA